MYKIFLFLMIIGRLALPAEIPGLYKCKTVLIKMYRNGVVSRKNLTTGSLYLNITRDKLSVFGVESGINICKDLPVDRLFRDTLFISPRLSRKSNDLARLYFNKDTLMGNYNFFDNSTADSAVVKIVTSKAPQSMLSRLQRQCR